MNRKVGHLYNPLMDRLMRVNQKVKVPIIRGAAATDLTRQARLLPRPEDHASEGII
jgi:hypothetical protein